MTTRPRTSKRKRPKEELKIVFTNNGSGEHSKTSKTMPSGNSEPRNSLGRLLFFFFFLSPPITQEARGGNERDLHARGRSIWPEAARSCETPAAMMARPCCRGHFITQFSRRGAHSPPPVSSYSRTPQNAEVAPVCPTASNLQPTVTRAADGRELSAGMGCRCSPPPRHITS